MDPAAQLQAQQLGAAIFVVFMVLAVGLDVTVEHLRGVFRRPLRLIGALLVNYVVVPAIVFGAVYALELPRAYAIGVLLVAAAPGGPVGAVLVQKAGGDVPFAVSLMALCNVLNTALTPALAVMMGVVSVDSDVPVGGMVQSIVLFQLLPLGLAVAWRNRHEASALVARRWFDQGTKVVLGLGVVSGLIMEARRIADVPPVLAVAALVPPIAGLVAGAVLSTGDVRARGTVAVVTGFRSMSVVLLLVTAWFPTLETVLATLVCSGVMLPVSALGAALMRRLSRAAPAADGSGPAAR
jgi:bile acid:Na+ symporter, BASS family